ncbi:MAG: thioredoxin domain-containing protein [Candidatus Omnitrophica bacterium]|nr:thioredoxin domain-containing protein [Candidatus Omnitrophota bacterium]
MKFNGRSFWAGVLLVLLLVAAVVIMKRRQPALAPLPEVPEAVKVYAAFPKVKGPESAPVKLVVFSDFECPSCRAASEVASRILEDYPGQVQLTYKHFPLTSHRWSPYAHQAAECMQVQGKFWAYHDMLYAKQREWATAQVLPLGLLEGYALELGADMDLFSSCMEDVAVSRGVLEEKAEGVRRQVSATPTFFIGTDRFVGPRELAESGVNKIRKTLGLPEIPVVPGPVAGAPQAIVAPLQPPGSLPLPEVKVRANPEQ